MGKESACQSRRHWRLGFDPWVKSIPRRRKWQPTPVFLPGKFHGQRSLVDYIPWGCKEADRLSTHKHWRPRIFSSVILCEYRMAWNRQNKAKRPLFESIYHPTANSIHLRLRSVNYSAIQITIDRETYGPDRSLSGSSVGIFQAKLLEWVAMLSSRGFPQPRDQTLISCISYIGRQVPHY